MSLTIGEKVKIIMNRKGVNMTELADRIGQSRQNLSNKMSRDNFTEKDARDMAEALGCEVIIDFRMEDGTII